MERESIEETTVGFLGDLQVAMGNAVHDGSFDLPSGSTGRGPACVLVPVSPEGESIWVGKGSVAVIHNTRWLVEEVRIPIPGEGIVTLRRLE